MKVFFIGLILFCNLYAEVSDEVGFGTGLTMISYAEQESGLSGENVSEAASGSFSSISSNLYYKFFHRDTYTLYLTSAFPLTASAGNTFFSGGIGVEYYFTNENNKVTEKSGDFSLSIDPKLRYFAIGEFNILYMAYVTETSQKNDVNAEIALGGGAIYNLGGDWDKFGIRGSGVVGRGVGVLTTSMNIRVFISAIYFL
jgi:hypothetical protein